MLLVDKQAFWDAKILGWEEAKYDRRSFPDVNRSVKFRLWLAEEWLRERVAGKIVVELACGSARLAKAILDAGAERYVGYDLSPNAINEARRRTASDGLASRVELVAKNVLSLEKIDADVCFSLGLLDWLELSEIHRLAERTRSPQMLHSFSERRRDWQQWLHRGYVFALYGHRSRGYHPRYYRERDLVEAFSGRVRVYREPSLSFGAFLSTP